MGRISIGTRAAAAGGITTLIDTPLNCFPSTVSEETLKLKTTAAKGRIFVDVGFWGGLVPENAFHTSSLERLLEAGVLGLKSFMCPSGINDFPMTNSSHIKEGLSVLAKYGRPLLVHVEMEQITNDWETIDDARNPRSYATYLKSRPASWMPSEGVTELPLKHAPTIWPFQLKKSKMEILNLSVLHQSVMQKIKKNYGQLCWMEILIC